LFTILKGGGKIRRRGDPGGGVRVRGRPNMQLGGGRLLVGGEKKGVSMREQKRSPLTQPIRRAGLAIGGGKKSQRRGSS